MAFLKVDYENSTDVNLYYEDHGSGAPVILIHGWPLSSRSWEKQVPALLDAGFRVITYDRRGFGESSKVATGYDDKRLAEDLNKLMTQLDLRDAVIVGFSMGGVEVARYLGTYGTERVRKAVFISAVTPFLLKTEYNPEGIEPSTFDEIRNKIIEDRPKFLSGFFKDFYNVGLFDNISKEALRMNWLVAIAASPTGTLESVDAWLPDFREVLSRIKIPVLVIHGDSDKTVPIESSGARMPKIIKNCEYRPIAGGPHGILWTHAAEVNSALLTFLGEPASFGRTMQPEVLNLTENEIGH